MDDNKPTLEELLKSHKISQKTFDRVTVAKEYIENKYNLKTIIVTKWNDIIEKINQLNISEKEKIKIKKEINQQETQKIRKKREKQTIRDYESLSIIGRGAFGEVHVCREIKTGNIYAIKKMKKEVLSQKNQVIHIRSEQLFMSKVKSPWIVDLKASFQEDDYLYLVMEFCPGGDFMSLLIKKDILPEEEARFYTAELILAVDSIHKLDCIHRDIKPDNILIDKNGHIKLSDFGLAKISDKLYENNKNDNFNKNKLTHQKLFSCVGTAYYVAPEVLNKTGYGKDIDWWSVGVIFFEMLVGYAPFCSEETKEVCYKVINWKNYLKIPDDITISKEAEDLINKMINNSDERLGRNGIEEIKKHPFFKGVDWDNIRNTKAPFIPDIQNDYDTKYFEKFEVEEPFYPPEKKYKKRKDIEFLGYTYKDDINDDDDSEIYKNIIKKYKVNNNKDKDKDNSVILRRNNKSNSNKKNNAQKLRNHNIKVNKNNKNISPMMPKQNYVKVNIGVGNRNKGNSPLYLKMNNLNKNKITNQQQQQQKLKKIKIGDKQNIKTDLNLAKSANNSKNKKKKMKLDISNNNINNKQRFIPPIMNNKFSISSNNWNKKLNVSGNKKNISNAISSKNVKSNNSCINSKNEKNEEGKNNIGYNNNNNNNKSKNKNNLNF
jgi:serine/threonine kinase 38